MFEFLKGKTQHRLSHVKTESAVITFDQISNNEPNKENEFLNQIAKSVINAVMVQIRDFKNT